MKIARRHYLWLLVFTLVLALTAGAALSSEVMMGNGAMQNCPYMGETGLCNMNVLEHLSQWQQMFVSVTPRISTSTLILLILALLLNLSTIADPWPREGSIVRCFCYCRKTARLFDYLRSALACGLIHPKIFWRA